MAHQQLPPKFTHSFMDSCAFNPGGSEEKCSRRLIRLSDDGEINLVIADSVREEIGNPKTPSNVKKRASSQIFTCKPSLTPEQKTTREEIRTLVQGNAKPGQHKNDADHIFDLQVHGGGYFITTDARLLSLSETLFNRYSVTTITPCAYEKLLNCDS